MAVAVFALGEMFAAAGTVKIGSVNTSEPGNVWAKLSNDAVTVAGEVYEHFQVTYGDQSISGYIRQSDAQQLPLQATSIPANFAGLEAVMVPTRLQDQLFRIYEVVEDEDCVTITARHVWYDNLENYTLWKPDESTEFTAANACRNILNNTISPANTRVASDCTDTKIGKELNYEKKNIVESFLDPNIGICAKFGLSMIRNNWDIYCLKEVGYDRGFVIHNSKNLLGVERTENIDDVRTRCAPIGKDDKGDTVWLDNNGLKYVDSTHINDYPYPRVEIYETGLQIGKNDVTSQNIQSKLLAAAQARFTDDHIDLPSVQMTIEFLSLGDTEEYAQYRGLDKVYLYDIVTIKDTIRGYDFSAQVIGVEHDILTGMLNSITIGDTKNRNNSQKVASWQVPSVSGSNIQDNSITANKIDESDTAAIAARLGMPVVIDRLDSTSTTSALSANQGRVLNNKFDSCYLKSISINTGSDITLTISNNFRGMLLTMSAYSDHSGIFKISAQNNGNTAVDKLVDASGLTFDTQTANKVKISATYGTSGVLIVQSGTVS